MVAVAQREGSTKRQDGGPRNLPRPQPRETSGTADGGTCRCCQRCTQLIVSRYSTRSNNIHCFLTVLFLTDPAVECHDVKTTRNHARLVETLIVAGTDISRYSSEQPREQPATRKLRSVGALWCTLQSAAESDFLQVQVTEEPKMVQCCFNLALVNPGSKVAKKSKVLELPMNYHMCGAGGRASIRTIA
ncbi:hypothetical protein BDW02DRAFT_607673 [Decorospora gaudefroyi]|uniref:Uncharacterized protein n=1 Tax=Decorospora gaudefroyi TaxID=184978 RepID=A0A6A5K8J8_9PLEO|nr:hypothetical protein BDW02DRAFT_607673 [Decorospora gaudefroyi]